MGEITDINLVLDILRTLQRNFELNYSDFRTDRSPGKELETAIVEIEKWISESMV